MVASTSRRIPDIEDVGKNGDKRKKINAKVGELAVIQRKEVLLHIIGDSPLIQHAFGAKYSEDRPGAAKTPGKKKVYTDQDKLNAFKLACHLMPGKKHPVTSGSIGDSWEYKKLPKDVFGIPCSSFGNAVKYIMGQHTGINKKTQVYAMGWMTPLTFSRLTFFEEYGRIPPRTGGRVPIWRPMFEDWSCGVIFQFDGTFVAVEDVINLVNRAGFESGVGDGRRSLTGGRSFGSFHVKI